MNYDQLRQLIIDETENDAPEFLDHIDDFIRAAEYAVFRDVDLRIFRSHWRSTTKRDDEYISLPTEASNIIVREIRILDSAGKSAFLLPKNESFMHEFWPDRSRLGQPRYYAHWSDTVLLVAPTPDKAYTIHIQFSSLLRSLVDGGDKDPLTGEDLNTTWLSTYAWETLLAGAMLEALAFMKAEKQAAGGTASGNPALWETKYEKAKQRLTVQEARERVDDYRARGAR